MERAGILYDISMKTVESNEYLQVYQFPRNHSKIDIGREVFSSK